MQKDCSAAELGYSLVWGGSGFLEEEQGAGLVLAHSYSCSPHGRMISHESSLPLLAPVLPSLQQA